MAQGFLRCVQWAPGTKTIVCGFLSQNTSPAQVRVHGCITTAMQHLRDEARDVMKVIYQAALLC